jgi:hypothetical protein
MEQLRRMPITLSRMTILLRASLVAAMAAVVSFSANAQLIPTTDGTMVYDSANGVTWLANANLAATNRFGLAACKGPGPQPCVYPSGLMQFQGATAWITAMNAANYLGHNNWQLPTTPISDGGCGKTGPQGNSFGFGCTLSALGSLYYKTLALNAPNTAVPMPLTTVGPFTNFQPYLYWTGSQGAAATDGNATLSFNSGFQGANTVYNFLYILPMIPGKLAGTPAATGGGLQVNPGGATVYDPVTNVTWLANANLAGSNTFGLPYCTNPTTPAVCVNVDGSTTLAGATQFIANMNAASYLGQTKWQLPTIGQSCTGFGCSANDDPLTELYYGQLALTQGTPVVSAPNIPVGPFNSIQPYLYWSCSGAKVAAPCDAAGPAPNFEWSFSFGNGFLGTDLQGNEFYAWPYFIGAPTNQCTYTLSAGGQAFTAAGGIGTITITTQPGCPWTVGPQPSWVTWDTPPAGVGSGSVKFEVSPNTGADLTNTFTIGDATYTLQLQSATIPGLNYVGSMPHLAAEGGWLTTFTFVNKSSTAATTRTNLFSPAGGALQLPVTLVQQPSTLQQPSAAGPLLASSYDQSIAPNAQFIMQASGSAQTYLEGSAQLSATGTEGAGAAVDGFAIFHFNPNNQEAVVPMETRNAASYLLAFDNTNGVLTGVALENVSSQDANVSVIIRDGTGAQIGTGSIPLKAFGHTSFVLSTQFPSTSNMRGTVEFDTPQGGQISALGIRYTGGTLTTIPVLANVGGSLNTPGGLMAHLAVGAGWQTTFALVNTGTAAASATLNFYTDNGAALPLPVTLLNGPSGAGSLINQSSITQTIAPNASLWIQASGAAASALLTGSAQLTTSGSVSGYAIFRYNPNGQEAVVPIESRNATSYVIPFDNTGGTVTGIALSLASSQNTNVPVIVRNDAGRQIGTGSIALNGNGHTSFTLNDPAKGYSATANIRGTLEFVTPSGAALSVLGIRSPPALTFTTLPALAK